MYLRGLERWLADLLQPVFDGLVAARSVPRFVQRLKIVEFTLDHEAPVFSNMRRRTSRKVVPCFLCSSCKQDTQGYTRVGGVTLCPLPICGVDAAQHPQPCPDTPQSAQSACSPQTPQIEIPANPDALQDSDLNGVVDIRYTGGARMLLLIELGRRKSKMRIKVWAALHAPICQQSMLASRSIRLDELQGPCCGKCSSTDGQQRLCHLHAASCIRRCRCWSASWT